MLNDEQITDFFKDCNLPLVSVVPKDQLPSKKYVGDYVINMQNDTDGNGTHWVYAKIKEQEPMALYWDSFGVFPPEEVKKFLHPLKIMFNDRQIQDINSECCGHYCEALAYFMKYDTDPKKTFEENYNRFIEMFSDDPKKNDKILKEYLKKNG